MSFYIFFCCEQLDESADNENFTKLLSHIKKPGISYEEKKNLFSLSSIISDEPTNYFSYLGSLTTPDCSENVSWMISTRFLKISSKELARFRELFDDKNKLLTKNFRPLQQLNSRELIKF